MILTADNYFSQEADLEFMSTSQYKQFAGCDGKVGCEAAAAARILRRYEPKPNRAMMVGSYVDTYFEGAESHERFRDTHPDIFTKSGDLRAEYRKADEIIERLQQSDFFMQTMSGEKQVIMTGEIFGVKWKIKIDSFLPHVAIVDLKIIESIRKLKWVRDVGYVDFIRYWGYDVQGAIYQEIVRQNTGEKLPFYIAAATKEETTDFEVIHVQDNFLQNAMSLVEANIERVKHVKYGKIEPERCGVCEYCLQTKVITQPIGILDLVHDV